MIANEIVAMKEFAEPTRCNLCSQPIVGEYYHVHSGPSALINMRICRPCILGMGKFAVECGFRIV